MADHPYRHLPDAAFWRRSVAGAGAAIDPVAGPFLRLSREDRVATAGSCFAQHIARHLAASGFNYLVTETAHPIVPADAARAAGYGLFTARYGNIYTTLQLVQLFDRAYGRFTPVEDVWEGPGGGIVDPFRPTIQPDGFASEAEMRADRDWHLAKVREAFETLDVFVFTLGLTECWVSRADGAAFPLCPGVAGGRFDADAHGFRNLRTGEVREQLGAFVTRLRSVNPRARVVLTVSPVPLAATASGNHVLPATIYSKAALRAAAQEAAEDIPDLWYFPSYEIVTGPQARGRFFADDLREVTEAGVAHVMSVFLRHAAGIEAPAAPPRPADESAEDGHVAAARTWIETMCDEAMLDAPGAETAPLTFAPFAAGLTNQKLALLGLAIAARREGRAIQLPDLVDYVPGAASQRVVPIGDVLALDGLADTLAGQGVAVIQGGAAEARDPRALFDLACETITETRRAGDLPALQGLCRPLAAMQPAAPIAAAAARVLQWLADQGVTTGCQLRIERDWRDYVHARLEPLFGGREALYLDHRAILAKVAAALGQDAGPLYVTCNEADLPVPAAAIRDDARALGLTLIFRSMIPAEPIPGPLAGAALDFAVAAALPRFIGHTRSTFFNALALSAHGAGRSADHWFYNGKAPRLKRRLDQGAFVKPWLAGRG